MKKSFLLFLLLYAFPYGVSIIISNSLVVSLWLSHFYNLYFFYFLLIIYLGLGFPVVLLSSVILFIKKNKYALHTFCLSFICLLAFVSPYRPLPGGETFMNKAHLHLSSADLLNTREQIQPYVEKIENLSYWDAVEVVQNMDVSPPSIGGVNGRFNVIRSRQGPLIAVTWMLFPDMVGVMFGEAPVEITSYPSSAGEVYFFYMVGVRQ